jgi:hypothetical protein
MLAAPAASGDETVMLANLVRVVVSAVVVVGAGVLLYLDDRVLGFVITSLTVGLLVFGLIGLSIAAGYALRAGLRVLRDAPEKPAASAQRSRHLRAETATSRR